jgi:hypothetical protein
LLARASLRKLDADLDKIVSIKVYLTDLAPYAEFSKVRGEVFPNNPPTSTAVQLAGLLLGARIEIDAVAFITASAAAARLPRRAARPTPAPIEARTALPDFDPGLPTLAGHNRDTSATLSHKSLF